MVSGLKTLSNTMRGSEKVLSIVEQRIVERLGIEKFYRVVVQTVQLENLFDLVLEILEVLS